MAVGQAVLPPVLDVGAMDAVCGRLEVAATARSAAHAGVLRDVLELQAVLSRVRATLSTAPQLALVLGQSEAAAQALLVQAELLVALPGGWEALACGLLCVEQTALLARKLAGLSTAVQLAVWARLQARLLADLDSGGVLPPARLAALLDRWVIAAEPQDAAERRRAAEAAGEVDHRRRDDGLHDLFALGITGPNMQAILCRIRERARPFGSADERQAGKRRLDALVDLLLGRDQLPLEPLDDEDPFHAAVRPHCGPQCGCRLGEPVPCGMDVSVLVPLGAALGTTDELAELVGHGPLEPDLLEAVLLTAPRLRPVWVDAQGVPVAIGDRTVTPARGDPAAVREALLGLAATRPPTWRHPRHPDDHEEHDVGDSDVGRGRRPGLRSRAHPAGTPGGYRTPARLARFLRIRAPRCEWPGCGHRAAGCDLDHDLPHPQGATCACNLGPLCRRHHRVKQQLMCKTRLRGSAVRWSDPTGRIWTSASQHQPPAPAVRPLPRLGVLADGPDGSEDLDGFGVPDDLDPIVVDPIHLELRAEDSEDHEDHDRLRARLVRADGWGLALDDPTRWTD